MVHFDLTNMVMDVEPCSNGVNWKSGKYLRNFRLLAVFLN